MIYITMIIMVKGFMIKNNKNNWITECNYRDIFLYLKRIIINITIYVVVTITNKIG